jgi:two-component system, sensor histidine kinase and response regulator
MITERRMMKMSNFKLFRLSHTDNVRKHAEKLSALQGKEKARAMLLNPIKTYFAYKKGLVEEIHNDKVKQKYEKTLETLEEELTALKNTNETKDLYFRIIAHDLRSKFGGMMGISGLMVKNFDKNMAKDPEKIRKHAEVINNSSNEAYLLTCNVKDWYMAQKEERDLALEIISLREIASDVIDKDVCDAADKKGVNIINKVGKDVMVSVERGMARAILRNLMTNAIKFVNENEGEIRITAELEDGKTVVKVIDNGIGMSEERASRIFEKAESTAGTKNEMGTGMGLQIVKGFVKMHKGTVWVESEVGKGTAFAFTLPSANLNA